LSKKVLKVIANSVLQIHNPAYSAESLKRGGCKKKIYLFCKKSQKNQICTRVKNSVADSDIGNLQKPLQWQIQNKKSHLPTHEGL